MSARSRQFVVLSLLNSFIGAPFAGAFIAVLIFTGTVIPILVALLIGAVVKFLYSLFINDLAPINERDAVFITGTSKGLGQVSALHLVDRGFTVFAGVRAEQDAEKMKQLVKKENKHRLITIIIDVVKPDTIDAAFKQIKSAIDSKRLTLRTVVNNSALANFGALEIVDIEKVKQMYDVNVFGMMRVNQAFLPLLRESVGETNQTSKDRRARLVLMSSLTALVPSPWMGAYSATKSSIESLADAYRMELTSSGVDVCIVEPGKMDTESQHLLDAMIPSSEELHKTVKTASSAVLDQYSKLYERVRVNVTKIAPWSTESVALTIEHIIRAKYAQPRYQCSPDVVFGGLILSHLPEVVGDRIMRLFMA